MENIVCLLLRRTESLIQEKQKIYCLEENHDHAYAEDKEARPGS